CARRNYLGYYYAMDYW
nr:immunoglobulin heavy chain junction region [Mus musculus]